MATLGLALTAILALSACGKKSEVAECKAVRFSDVGWSDITATNGMAKFVLTGLGYEPSDQSLSVPVTYTSLKNKDIDVFLGNWMPSMANDRKAYVDDKSVEVLRANLEGAKYTLAVPTYLADKGLKDFTDIAKFHKELGGKIYGIEAGNDGNRLIDEMIKADKFGLGKFKLVESSEQGMLGQVEKMGAKNEAIVFLGWAPHPMNIKFKMTYLTGGDDVFGPNFGEAKIYTNIRAGYAKDCANVGAFLNNLAFTVDMESDLMNSIADKKMEPMAAAKEYLKAHPEVLDAWLKGVTTIDGKPGIDAVKASLGS
ncbi:MAG: choline ABC transporter substrate-binding protein [Candidatus Pacebacteria bacterium]|nr:choline ABC transporter substrate-binding protein [Candidatus Paceibacterota bacterium]